jgi:hypothetical protein
VVQVVVFVDEEGDAQDLEDDATAGWEDPVPVVDAAAEWKRKYEELLAESSKPATKAAAKPAAAPIEVAVAEEKEEKKEKKKAPPRKSAPEPAEEVQRRGGKKQRLTLKQVQAIQRQAVRMERYHQSELDSAARDTMALAGADSDGDY